MADQDLIRITHPETGGVFETSRKQYDEVWASKGWVETSNDAPLTDWRYQENGGGEAQPPPTPVGEEGGVTEQLSPTAPGTARPTPPAQPAPTE